MDRTNWNQKEIDKFTEEIKSKTIQELQVILHENWPPDNATMLIKSGRINAEIIRRGYSLVETKAILAPKEAVA